MDEHGGAAEQRARRSDGEDVEGAQAGRSQGGGVVWGGGRGSANWKVMDAARFQSWSMLRALQQHRVI